MTNTTPRAGYPAPTDPGKLFPTLLPHQRKHMLTEQINGIQTLTWFYKVVISTQNGAKMPTKDAILAIGHAVVDHYKDDISIVNHVTNNLTTEDDLVDFDLSLIHI